MTAGRGDALLQQTHLVSQVRLVTHGGRHAAQKGRHLRTGLGVTEDVVDEEEHVLLLHIAEVLRHGQTGQGDAQTGARGLVHLAEDERRLVDDAGVGHFLDEVVALTGTLTDAREDRHTVVVVGDAVDHFLDQNGLADTGTTEQTDLSTLDVRGEKVDDLDAGLEHLGLRLELVEAGRLAVDRPALGDVGVLLRVVQHLTQGVEDLALGEVADGDGDALARVGHRGLADQTVGRLHRDGTDEAVTQVLRDLEGQGLQLAVLGRVCDLDLEGVVDLGHGVDGELHVDDRADDPGDAAVAAAVSMVVITCHSPRSRLPWRWRHRRSR